MQTKAKQRREAGFTLTEAMVGLVMFAAALGGLLPIIMVSRAFTIKSDSRIGGSAVAQQIMDTLRQTDIPLLPSSGIETTLPSHESIASLSYKGKLYSATITYCETASYCDTSTRHLKVKVYQDGNTSPTPVHTQDPVYQLETVYTRLQ
jgi:type II secretory pathway pseudopilin PulG